MSWHGNPHCNWFQFQINGQTKTYDYILTTTQFSDFLTVIFKIDELIHTICWESAGGKIKVRFDRCSNVKLDLGNKTSAKSIQNKLIPTFFMFFSLSSLNLGVKVCNAKRLNYFERVHIWFYRKNTKILSCVMNELGILLTEIDSCILFHLVCNLFTFFSLQTNFWLPKINTQNLYVWFELHKLAKFTFHYTIQIQLECLLMQSVLKSIIVK